MIEKYEASLVFPYYNKQSENYDNNAYKFTGSTTERNQLLDRQRIC